MATKHDNTLICIKANNHTLITAVRYDYHKAVRILIHLRSLSNMFTIALSGLPTITPLSDDNWSIMR